MTRAAVWFAEAVQDLLDVPSPDDAAVVDGAVTAFAETSRGFVRRIVREGEADSFVLYTSTRYVAVVRWDSTTVYVHRIFLRPS